MLRRLVLLGVLVGGLVGGSAYGQAWTQPPGQLYAKVSVGAVTASEQYAFDGETTLFIDGVDDETFRDRSLYLYAELGLTEWATLVAQLPYKRTTIEDAAFRYQTEAVGAVTLGLRTALLPLVGAGEGPNALALNAALAVPTGYTRNFAPSAGAGQVDAEASLAYGRSFYPLPLYAQASAGFRYRTTVYGLSSAVDCQEGRDLNCTRDQEPDYGNEWLYAAEVGWTPLDRAVLIQGLVRGVWSVREPEVGFTAINPLPTRQRYLKVGGGVAVYPFRWFGVEALETLGLSVQGFATPSGRNTIKSQDWFIGLEIQRTLF